MNYNPWFLKKKKTAASLPSQDVVYFSMETTSGTESEATLELHLGLCYIVVTPVRNARAGWVDRACAVRSILCSVRQEKRRGDTAEGEKEERKISQKRKTRTWTRTSALVRPRVGPLVLDCSCRKVPHSRSVTSANLRIVVSKNGGNLQKSCH